MAGVALEGYVESGHGLCAHIAAVQIVSRASVHHEGEVDVVPRACFQHEDLSPTVFLRRGSEEFHADPEAVSDP